MSEALTSVPRPPQPGEGAYLSAYQPGDGRYLAQQSQTQSSQPGGRASAPRADGQRRSRPGRGRGRAEGAARGPARTLSRGAPSETGDQPKANEGRKRPQRPRKPRDVVVTNGTLSDDTNGVRPSAALDASAPTFVPTSTPSSRPGSPNVKQRNRSRPKKDKNKPAEKSAPPTQAKSSRRAAFEQSAKLSKPDEAESGEKKKVDKPKPRKEKVEKDDLVSRLTRGLKSRPYLECPICFNGINPSQAIWSCLPPTTPPPAPKSPEDPPVNPSSHYSACYTPFHLSCIRDWASRSLQDEKERARNAGRDEGDITWRCPGCQKRRPESLGGYKCFCGRLSSPPVLNNAPHSCGDSCSRKRPGCSHDCPLPCHPGPCPPCQVALVVPCPSHQTPLTVKCSVASSNNAALTPVCDETCERQLDCGHKEHVCEELCHYGPCAPCSVVETVRCYCGEESRDAPCGWKRSDELLCSRLDDNGEEERWAGRFACDRACDRMYDCDIHPCEKSCHPHPIHPLPCPMSPQMVVTCPCGSTPLSQLDAPPRKDCLAPVPTCKSQCPKSRACGHQCPLKCHTGDCPPCHEEVVRPCRCGESMLVVPCDELREKAETGEDVTCERVCKALRNCGRHECGRVCCPLSYQAKNRKAKRHDDSINHGGDDLHECHLDCGKLLSCGIHTCKKKDHKGACGRCLDASYDELVCHCGHTVVYPPVACGTTITCLYPCARDPPSCGHPPTPHQCHENEQCPPCPFLTTKPCACGKDPAVKNVRCSQEKVSCGQPCGTLLACGYHRCEKPCHRPGECEPCHQACNKPKKICRHPCTAACHAPTRCSENDPCQAIVTQSCACGHVQQRNSCGASISNPTSRTSVVLKCNSECAVRQRNARLADALGISNKDRGKEEAWPSELRAFAQTNLAFVRMVESTFADFIKGPRQTMILPYMPIAKRTFVMSLADVYHLGRELIDAEPNRSVQIRRRLDTKVPTPLLSAVSQPPPKPLGGLANLRAPAFKPRVPVSASSSAEPSRTTSPAPPSAPPAKAPTPVVPPGSNEVNGQVGKVDDMDWDESGDES